MNQGRRQRARGTRRAFSLIELIVVLVVVSILAATATASFTATTSTRQNMAGQQLRRDLAFARERAAACGAGSWITLNTATDTYTLSAENLDSPGYAGAAALNDPATGRAYTITLDTDEFVGVGITGVSIPGGTDTLGFDWLGRPVLPAGTLITTDSTITLTGGHVVTIKGGTGLVRYTP